MIDPRLLLKNLDIIKENCKKRNVDIDLEKLVNIKKEANELIKERDRLRHILNLESKGKPEKEKLKELKEIKERIKNLEDRIEKLNNEFDTLIRKIPNIVFDDVPVGKNENDNVVIREVGEKPKFDFEPKDHLTIGEKLDIIDVKRASKISGSRFGYLKNEGALLEIALIKFVFDNLTDKNIIEKIIKENNLKVKIKEFIPVIPPVMIKPEIMQNLGYVDSGDIEFFKITEDNLVLVGTAEHSIVSMFKDEILNEKDLPLRFLGFSTCFRREAGSYGKDVRGILRVHQFDKIEMVSFTKKEESREEHRFILAAEEYLVKKLNLPYRVVRICTGDMAHPNAEQFDIETWMPSENRYRETHSTSNTTDFQARRLNIRVKRKNGIEFVHIINGTAIAIGRTIISIIENFQTKNGEVKIPEELIKYLGFEIIR
ncbi:MAG: serine--tRNA ligase [Minisyncoccia bacterium]